MKHCDTCDGLGLRGDGAGRSLCLCRGHRFLRHKLDRAGGPGRRARELATALLVRDEGVEVVELLLADATDVDVRGELHQHRGASWNWNGSRWGSDSVIL